MQHLMSLSVLHNLNKVSCNLPNHTHFFWSSGCIGIARGIVRWRNISHFRLLPGADPAKSVTDAKTAASVGGSRRWRLVKRCNNDLAFVSIKTKTETTEVKTEIIFLRNDN